VQNDSKGVPISFKATFSSFVGFAVSTIVLIIAMK